MQDFKQLHTSSSLSHFHKGFSTKWRLDEYKNHKAPAVFFGMYNTADIKAFQKHTGPKIIVFGGNDMHSTQLKLVKREVDAGKCFAFNPPGEFSNTLKLYKIPHKQFYLGVKSYSSFQPTALGDKIYCYIGQPSNRRLEYFMFDKVIKPLIKNYGEDKVVWVTGSKALPESELISRYYNNCFVYIKPNSRGGATSMWELGHMGIKTVGKGHSELPNFEEYGSVRNLLELIEKESVHIGQVREDVALGVRSLFIGEEWLSLNFWNNE